MIERFLLDRIDAETTGAPVTDQADLIAGALAQQNAEALAGLAFAQIVRPGYAIEYDYVDPIQLKPSLECPTTIFCGDPFFFCSAICPIQVADYYNQTFHHYRRWWKLDKALAVHYGIWDAEIRTI